MPQDPVDKVNIGSGNGLVLYSNKPDNKVQGANMGPTWVLSALDGPHIGLWTLLSGKAQIYMTIGRNDAIMRLFERVPSSERCFVN